MTENTETAAFMRCRRCGFELHLPKWAVDEIEKGYPDDDQLQIMLCPECGGDMYEPRILATMPPYKTYHIPAKKKSRKKHK